MSEPSSSTGILAGEEVHRNGSLAASPEKPTASPRQDTPSVDRADELVDALSRKVAAGTAIAFKGLLRFLARVGEEASDIWAEAQNVRHGDKPKE